MPNGGRSADACPSHVVWMALLGSNRLRQRARSIENSRETVGGIILTALPVGRLKAGSRLPIGIAWKVLAEEPQNLCVELSVEVCAVKARRISTYDAFI